MWTGRRDKRGIPVYIYKVSALDSKTMNAYFKSSQRTNLSISSTASAMSVTEPSTPTSSGFFAAPGKNSQHAHKDTPPRMLRLFAIYENLTRFVMPLCSLAPGRPNPEAPITQARRPRRPRRPLTRLQTNNIVDISNVGLRQFWNLRTHMQDASTLATAHYPETLDRIFVRHGLLS